MQIFLICSTVCTLIWLHYLDFNKMLEENATLELHKNAACYFEKNPESSTPLFGHLPPISQSIQVI